MNTSFPIFEVFPFSINLCSSTKKSKSYMAAVLLRLRTRHSILSSRASTRGSELKLKQQKNYIRLPSSVCLCESSLNVRTRYSEKEWNWEKQTLAVLFPLMYENPYPCFVVVNHVRPRNRYGEDEGTERAVVHDRGGNSPRVLYILCNVNIWRLIYPWTSVVAFAAVACLLLLPTWLERMCPSEMGENPSFVACFATLHVMW